MDTRKTPQFYDGESSTYAEMRYAGRADSFQKFFFQKRLALLIEFAEEAAKGKEAPSLLDIGCADGYVTGRLKESVAFGKVIGVDTSEGMIKAARDKNTDPESVRYFLKGEEPAGAYDCIAEIGVPVSDYRGELSFAAAHLNEGGSFIYSTPGSRFSLFSAFKGNRHVEKTFSFGEFEAEARKSFDIERAELYGFFIPKLWIFQSAAPAMQRAAESIFKYVAPWLFHEKIYLLRKKPAKA